jgi:hypothetical protein
VIDNALGGGVIDAGKALEIVSRGVVDVDCPLLLDALHNTLGYRLSVANRGRSGASRLLANFVRATVVRGAASKCEKCQRNQNQKPHTGFDAVQRIKGGRNASAELPLEEGSDPAVDGWIWSASVCPESITVHEYG